MDIDAAHKCTFYDDVAYVSYGSVMLACCCLLLEVFVNILLWILIRYI